MSDRCAVFIDGGYVDKIQGEMDNVKIDYSKMVEGIVDRTPLLRVYYYNCLPYQSALPSPEEIDRFSAKQKFFNRLKRLPNFTVREGKLAARTVNGTTVFEQKRVDVFLATDLVMHATKRLITSAHLFAGDSDFIPAIEIAKSEGVNVTLYSVQGVSSRPHEELVHAVDIYRVLTQTEFRNWEFS